MQRVAKVRQYHFGRGVLSPLVCAQNPCIVGDVSFSQVEYFVAVAEEGSLSRAARRLHVSQPPLTRQMHALEDELGVRLFTRSARGMQLLPAGEELLVHARKVLSAVQTAIEATREADRASAGAAG